MFAPASELVMLANVVSLLASIMNSRDRYVGSHGGSPSHVGFAFAGQVLGWSFT